MDAITDLMGGFAVVFSPETLIWVFVGVMLGTVIGVLPGLGPASTIAILLPITYSLPAEAAIIMLAGIYYGSMYGGTITSVLLRLPGEAASVVTTFDGYQMARAGRAGPALGISAIGSFIGGTVAVIGLTFVAPLLASVAVGLGPPDYVALAVLGLVLVSLLGTGSLLKALIPAGQGLWLASIGQDPVTGAARFAFGSADLIGGLHLVPMVMGLFGIGEILYNLGHRRRGDLVTKKVEHVLPRREDLRRSRGPIARGSVTGFLIGLLPGGGGVVSSLLSYTTEKRISKHPDQFGKGAIEGVAGPETANNASSTSSFIPLLTLGLPPNPVLALIFGALLLQGITPGPTMIETHPEVFWGVIASMYVGNVILLALNLPLVGIFVQLLRVKQEILAPLTILVTVVGVYSVNNRVFDVGVAVLFGVIGYLMRKSGYAAAPLVLAFVLGSVLEPSLRQSLILSEGGLAIFLQRPVAVVLPNGLALG
ncbi:tripartite tricarboxylate transporter permease [Pseudonocardia nigra]|uniref:tripartite tricarboxylate transporter permease n=1 Tax=Pseudonocardia nigra TaxID=1921578 RepID=UPI001C5D5919|nr:tripartite tricarboxylate transporter permease [Pseudonocardia nigra]